MYMNGMGFGWLWMVAILLFSITVLVFMVKSLFSGSSNQVELETPMETLKRRYARGEIDKSDFEQRKKDLITEVELGE